MKIIKAIILLLLLTGLLGTALPVYAQSTVVPAVGGANGFIYDPHQRMSFYANGSYWAFYINDTTDKLCYRTSTDATTWNAEVNIRTGVTNSGYAWSITYDDTYVHYIIRAKAAPNDAFYRRGLPNADGTITWSAIEQTVIASNTQNHTIAVDTSGYVYLSYGIAGAQVNVNKNANNDGTWSTAVGWPQILNAAGGPPMIVALTDSRMACLWGKAANTIKIQRWDGVAWGAERAGTSVMERAEFYSAVAEDDDIHVVFLEDVSYDLIYVKYDYSTNSFGDETTLYSGATATSAPVITRDTDTNNLYVFWENDPTNDHIYYIKYNYYNGAWDTYIDLIDESVVDGLPANGYNLNTDYTSTSDKVGVYYIADPQKLKYKDVAEVAIVATLAPTGVTTTSATLRGEITSTGTGAITVRGIQYNTTPSATGAGYTEESGSFGTGVYSFPVTDFEADEIYYCRAYATNSEGTAYGEWVAWISAVQGSEPEQPDEPDEGMAPPVDTEGPGNWVTDPSTRTFESWPFSDVINAFADMVSRSFAWFCFMVFAVALAGIALCKYTRHLGITFLALGMLLGLYIAGDAIDWWLIFPYLLVGISLIIKEQQYGWG